MKRRSSCCAVFLAVAGLVVSSQGFLVGRTHEGASPPITRMEARKRSRVNVGEEEIRYYSQAEDWMARDLESTTTPHVPTAETEVAGVLPPTGARRFAAPTDRRHNFANRDRRVMMMGEDERAYYDRLNAYKGDRPMALGSATPKAVVIVPKDKEVGNPTSVRFSSSSSGPTAAAPGGDRGVAASERMSSSSSSSSPSSSMRGQGVDSQQEALKLLRTRILESDSSSSSSPLVGNTNNNGGGGVLPTTRYAAEMSRWNQEGKPSVVLALWDRMRSEGLRPTTAIYGQTLRACCMVGDHATAMVAMEEIRVESIGSSSMDLYAAGLDWGVRLLSRSRRYMQAIDLLEGLSSKGAQLRASSFNIMMVELAKMKKWREVIKIMALMKVYKIAPNAESYSWAITAHVAIGDMHEAIRLLTEMGDEGMAPSEQAISRWNELAGLNGDQRPLWGLQG